jgi:sigma-B regulation protein RsbU (phosphoserine phosphatase)
MSINRPYKILVVDDEPDLEPLILQRMRRDIRRRQYTFVFARNGLEALEKLGADETIDLVLSDINMPQMDGLTLLSQIPNVSTDVRSVIISAYGDMKNIRTAMNRGAFDFVTKPIDFEDLRVTIERTLSHLLEWRDALESRNKLTVLQNELDIASTMQQSLLPNHFPEGETFQVFGRMEPARNVGGDFFDILNRDHHRLGVVVADVSDKGVPAALFMMSSRTLIRAMSIGSAMPGEVLASVNELLLEDNDSTMFVTLFYAVYDPENGMFTYANGGHNPPLLVHPDGSSEELPLTGGIALGLVSDFKYVERTLRLMPGDALILYTDGVTEAMNEELLEFGVPRLIKVFEVDPPSSAEDTTGRVFEAVHDFAGEADQSDDITCLVLHRRQ